MRVKWADQYNMNCVVPEPGDTADELIQACWDDEAIRTVDGEEFCVELRSEVGPELWTEESLRRSLEDHDAAKVQPDDPVSLTWTPEQGAYVTEHDGARWALIAHAVHRGKAGWSGTDEWCLHRIDPPEPVTGYGTWAIDHGRWLAKPGLRGLSRAKQIAAWIIANPDAADAMTHHQITDALASGPEPRS